ncbi:hypothetical protein GQ55_7G294200 [Panicum hallii var. hallii]|uniref:Uncharacterized protein n=1 Tax=Panicum hallii var. hallii TaxID=1504633 RepID=A0A2T7D0F7_9POAL|nr:hypothetical protein GQ55_7G294200 [Panicum hallii var. hallii]
MTLIHLHMMRHILMGMRELLPVMLVMRKIWEMYEMLLRKHWLEDIDNVIYAKNYNRISAHSISSLLNI